MDVFMLVVTIIGAVLSLLIDLYLLVIYMHRDEQKLRPISIFCMIVIVITLLQVQLQPLFLLFDVISSRSSGTVFTYLWVGVYFSILANLAFLKPLASSLYEADEEDGCCTRSAWTVVEVIITIAGFGVFLGVGWLFWGKIYLPVQEITVDTSYVQNADIAQSVADTVLEVQITVPCFLIGMLCIMGYPILACCGACGLSALPFSLFVDFINRPKWRRTNEARLIADKLKEETVLLIKEADRARRAVNRIEYVDGWLSRRKKNQEVEDVIATLQSRLAQHRSFYELFRLQLDMQNTNPWVFILKLVAGVFCVLLTPLWLVQILLAQLVYDHSVFLDKFLVLMEREGASFVSVGFILLLTFYMIIATLKGIFFVSEAMPFFKIHPMKEGKTWLNSFMFQASIAVLASTSMVHLLVTTFPEYLRGGDIALLMGAIMEGMLFVGVFIRNRVFIYILLIMSVLGTIFSAYRLFCSQSKSEAQQKVESIRKKLFGKDKQNADLGIEMTEMNLREDKNKKGSAKKEGASKKGSSKKPKSKIKLILE